MNESYFKITFGILWLAYVLIRVPHEQRYKQFDKKTISGAARERIMVFILLIGMGVLPLIWVFSSRFDDLKMDIPLFVRYVGIAIALFSLWYFWWIHKTLGENWSPILEIRKDHELIKTGPYKRIRHPMYTQIWLWSIAQALIISNWVVGLAGIILWAILYCIRIPNEEKMLLDEFGDDYKNYQKLTGRIFPKF